MFQTTNQHSFVSEMSEIHPSSSDKRENNGLKVQFHRWYLTEWWSLLEQKWRSKAYVHLSQPGTGNHVFFYCFIFLSFWLSFFWIENYHSPLSPLSFFIIFSFLFFLPLAFSCFFPLLRKWSLVLGNCHQGLFLEPFSFLFILFRFCIVLVIFPSFALKIVLGNYQKEFFLEPFSFFFRFCIVLAMVPSFALKIDLGDCQKTLFSNPFRCFSVFFRFGYFSSFAFKIDLGNCQKGQKEFFPFFFRFLFHFRCFSFFLSFPFSCSFSFSFFFSCFFCLLFSFFVHDGKM